MPYGEDITGFSVSDVELVGEETGLRYSFPGADARKVYDLAPDKLARTARLTAGHLTKDRFKYEAYRVSARIVVHEHDGSYREETVGVLLTTRYETQYRSDWFDKIMSV